MSTVMGAIGEATGMKPEDTSIVIGAMNAAKAKASFYLMSLLEASTPELRQILSTHLQDAINEHHRWAELAIKRGWYKANDSAEGLVQHAVQLSEPVLRQ